MKPLVEDLYSSADTQPASHAGRVVFAVSVIVVGYHSTLLTLIDRPFHAADVRIAAVFLLAVALAYAHRRVDVEVSIHDRQVDWIVGVPLVLLAIAMNVSSFQDPPSTYWAHRVDLFSLPIFVAGITALLFGLRALGSQRGAIAFLFLAWPGPYNYASNHWLGGVTGGGALMSVVVVGLAVHFAAHGRPLDLSPWHTGGTTREYLSGVGQFRPPVRGAVCCAVIAAVAMGWLTQVGAP